MTRGGTRLLAALTGASFLVAACSGADGARVSRAAGGATSSSLATVTSAASTTVAAPTTPTAIDRPTTTTRPRVVHAQPWVPFAEVGGVTLVHPSRLVEVLGFHESANDGAREMRVLRTAASPRRLESRDRGTRPHTAVDIVVHPRNEIRAPVTGVVKRAGRYVLYCDHVDNFVVIEPDGHPGWEVKILHIDGLAVASGQRVTAGETVVAPKPRKLPFESQVDEITAAPAWPHVHVEVVDPTIPDRPTPGGGCN